MNPIEPTVVWLTTRQLLARRRLWVIALLALAPVAITLLFVTLGSKTDPSAGEGFLATLSKEIVVGTVLPLAAVLFGTGAFGGEMDDGTLLYLLVKPIARWRVVVSKFVVAFLATVTVVIPAIMLPWLLVRTPTLTIGFPASFLGGALVGAFIYVAIFLALGLATRKALIFGLLYVIGFEAILTRSFAGVRSLSVREFSLTIAQWFGEFVGEKASVSMQTVATMGSLMVVGALIITVLKLQRYEVAERL